MKNGPSKTVIDLHVADRTERQGREHQGHGVKVRLLGMRLMSSRVQTSVTHTAVELHNHYRDEDVPRSSQSFVSLSLMVSLFIESHIAGCFAEKGKEMPDILQHR